MNAVKEILDRLVFKLFGLKNLSYDLEFKPGFGDLSANLAFVVAGKKSLTPREVAEKIKDNFSSEMVGRVDVAGAGFINFELIGRALLEELKKENFAIRGSKAKTQIEFISANPTGPLTLGNGRGGFYGDAIANVLEKAGERVKREYYVNDLGRQIEELGKSVLGTDGRYRGAYITDISQKIFSEPANSAASEVEVGKRAAEFILQNYIQPVIKKLAIRYDYWQTESELYRKYDIKEAIAKLRSQDVLYEKRGAVWFRSTRYGDDKDRVLRRQKGEWTYLASDMLYLIDRQRRGFDKIILVWGADHHGYISRYLALAQALGWKKAQIKIIISQLVRLRDGGQSLRMSKRTGRVIYLEDLVDKIGLDAARWFFLEKSPSTHLDFEVKKALKKDLTNPVYYTQYGYVRAQSILKKPEIQNQKPKINWEEKASPLQKQLALKLLSLPPVVLDIYQTLEVYKLPHLALDLAQTWQKFYEKERVVDRGKVSGINLLLTQKTAQALGLFLDLMGISKPEKM